VIARPLSWIGYTVFSLILVRRFQQNYPVKQRIPFSDARQILRFMTVFLWVCLLTEMSFIVLTVEYLLNFLNETQELATFFWLQITSVGVAVIPGILLIFPEILYGIPRWQKSRGRVSTEVSLDPVDLPADDSHAGSSQTVERDDREDEDAMPQFQSLASRITRYMNDERPWLDPDFSLDDMARTLEVPKHHLYYCYNSILKTRFTRMRSEFRIAHACKLLDQGETRGKTIEAIGLASGFASRSSFLTTFREIKGMAPSDYLKRQKA
jgi:AraC-like DNA-binding protein